MYQSLYDELRLKYKLTKKKIQFTNNGEYTKGCQTEESATIRYKSRLQPLIKEII
jgi:hypothetical protein